MIPHLAGERGIVACLATGPSLTAEDCEACRGRAAVIAINDAWRLAPWADVLYSSDRRWWRHYDGVPAFPGLKYGIGSAPGKQNGLLPGITVLRNAGYDGLELVGDRGIRNGKNSGYAAINLAVHLGARRILLLGYNLNTAGGRVHFFGDHPRGLPQNPALYPGFCRVFATLIAPLAAAGITVINCTADSRLQAFPCLPLAEALAPAAAIR